MSDMHIVYAVTELPSRNGGSNLVKNKISTEMSYDAAVGLWVLADRLLQQWPMAIGNGAVQWFAVRSADDPNWPAQGHAVSNEGVVWPVYTDLSTHPRVDMTPHRPFRTTI